jgi:hypothetical protein
LKIAEDAALLMIAVLHFLRQKKRALVLIVWLNQYAGKLVKNGSKKEVKQERRMSMPIPCKECLLLIKDNIQG